LTMRLIVGFGMSSCASEAIFTNERTLVTRGSGRATSFPAQLLVCICMSAKQHAWVSWLNFESKQVSGASYAD
jgi:hypothetical protein